MKSTVADPRLTQAVRVLSYGPKFSQFHAVVWKSWQNYMLAPPPTGNPGSAPGAQPRNIIL